MPIPRHSTALPSVQLAAAAACDGVTELRVHGVGGTPPDALLGDLAPQQASGDAIAGFYRSSDHQASAADQAAARDANRHVECYSWGGLTSNSKVRVCWLVLLPFLLGNLAGWMCSAKTRRSGWRFRLHRLTFGLGALALTVNSLLVAVMISADVLGYQAARAGLAGHQWWLAPLSWHYIAGHPARGVLIGVLAPVLVLLVIVWLATRSWRYESVRPPYREDDPPGPPRRTTAAALDGGLANDDFWDGAASVRQLTQLHVAVALGFFAIALGVTAKAVTATAGSDAVAWWWIAVGAGGISIALAVIYLCLDAFDALSDTLRGSPLYLLILAAVALISSFVFAWLRPGGPGRPAADLPGMASVIRWTALAIAIAVAAALISMLLGVSGAQGTLAGGPWVTLMLAFGLLNTFMLNLEIWVAHLVGSVTNDAATALSRSSPKIYLPYVITAGAPLIAWAVVVAAVVFGLAELFGWWRTRQLSAEMCQAYQDQTRAFREGQDRQNPELKVWYWSGLSPFAPPGDSVAGGSVAGDSVPGQDGGWEQKVARTQFLARAPHDAGWALWGIIGLQLAAAICVWQLHWQPPTIVRNLGVAIAGFAVPALMAYLYAAWGDTSRRRQIGILWDVGTFWPRSYHPLSPPCYTERAIPELQRRMWWLHSNGGRVVLVAHSQGAMLATAALVQPGCRPKDDYPTLITFGSPVCKLYGWGFPAYVTPELLTPLEPGGKGRLTDWRNFFYPTDPIGGPVAGDLSRAGGGLVDQSLLDPGQCWYVYGQPPPVPQGHSGYWADLRVWEVINEAAAAHQPSPGLAEAGASARLAEDAGAVLG